MLIFGDETLLQELRIQGTVEHRKGLADAVQELTSLACLLCRVETCMPSVLAWVWGSMEVPGKGRKLNCAHS